MAINNKDRLMKMEVIKQRLEINYSIAIPVKFLVIFFRITSCRKILVDRLKYTRKVYLSA